MRKKLIKFGVFLGWVVIVILVLLLLALLVNGIIEGIRLRSEVNELCIEADYDKGQVVATGVYRCFTYPILLPHD